MVKQIFEILNLRGDIKQRISSCQPNIAIASWEKQLKYPG